MLRTLQTTVEFNETTIPLKFKRLIGFSFEKKNQSVLVKFSFFRAVLKTRRESDVGSGAQYSVASGQHRGKPKTIKYD